MPRKQSIKSGITASDRIVLRYLLTHRDPIYPTKISKELKNEVSRDWTGQVCKKFYQMGILAFKKILPPRQKNKTEAYYIKSGDESFKTLSDFFLTSPDINDDFFFIHSDFVQQHLTEDWLRRVLFENQFFTHKEFLFTDLLPSEQKEYNEIYNKYSGCIYFFKIPSSIEREEAKRTNPEKKICVDSLHFINIRFPIFPKEMSEKERIKWFIEFNTVKLPDSDNLSNEQKQQLQSANKIQDEITKRLYHFSIVKKYYEHEKEELNDLFTRFLVLLQLSPNALRTILFEFNHIIKLSDPQEWVGKDHPPIDGGIILPTGLLKIIISRLVYSTIFDLSRSIKIPQNSIVKSAYVSQTETFEKGHILTLELGDERYIEYHVGFCLDKDGIRSISTDEGTIIHAKDKQPKDVEVQITDRTGQGRSKKYKIRRDEL